MSAEVICVGSELLLGDIVNTNAQYFAQELAKLGIPHYYQTVVGDNIQRIHQVLEVACSRAEILLFTGGLGPTPDDLTCEAIAQFFGAPLIESAQIVQDITNKFAQLNRPMTSSNLKQALIPEGAEILPNPSGTAPGIIWQVKDKTIMTFPGVPSEMYRMWQETAKPYLISLGWGQNIIYSQMLRFRGIGESALAEKVRFLLDSSNPTVGTYASQGEVRLRVSALASSETEAIALINPVAEQIKQIAGLDYFGSDEDTLEAVVGNLLKTKKQTLAVAESCTGGGLGQMLTNVSGSSEYFRGGVIAYDNQVKISLLGVSPEILATEGAVSESVAKQMANGVKKLLKTDWGVSITGIAGPGGGTETKPVGLVYIGIAEPEGQVESFVYRLGVYRTRSSIRNISSCNALDQLRRLLLKT